jgi:hypothetical protein
MSRSRRRCLNRLCSVPHGAVLDVVTSDESLVLDVGVISYRVYPNTRQAAIRCPICGTIREFRGSAVFSPHVGQ